MGEVSDASHRSDFNPPKKMVKYITLACINFNWELVYSTSVMPQTVNKVWLEQLNIIITKPFRNLI